MMSGFFKLLFKPVNVILAPAVSIQTHNIPRYLPAISFLFAAACTDSSTSNINKMPGENVQYLRFVKLTPHAFSPSKGSDKAAGFDLKSAYNYVVPPRSKEMVKTDVQIMLPEGCYGRVAPRSGLSWKNSIDVGAGVIDEDYRGDVRVILFNHSDEPFTIQPGDRIAQLICERIFYPELQEVKELKETVRGSGGFGSTGKN